MTDYTHNLGSNPWFRPEFFVCNYDDQSDLHLIPFYFFLPLYFCLSFFFNTAYFIHRGLASAIFSGKEIMRFSWFGFVDWIRFRPGRDIATGVAIWPMVPLHSVQCARCLRKEICWVILFSSSKFHPLGGAPILRLRPVEMITVY